MVCTGAYPTISYQRRDAACPAVAHASILNLENGSARIAQTNRLTPTSEPNKIQGSVVGLAEWCLVRPR